LLLLSFIVGLLLLVVYGKTAAYAVRPLKKGHGHWMQTKRISTFGCFAACNMLPPGRSFAIWPAKIIAFTNDGCLLRIKMAQAYNNCPPLVRCY